MWTLPPKLMMISDEVIAKNVNSNADVVIILLFVDPGCLRGSIRFGKKSDRFGQKVISGLLLMFFAATRKVKGFSKGPH